MKNAEKKVGIWMDHSNAHITEFTPDSLQSSTITSQFTTQEKIETLAKSENVMHNKEQQQQATFYKEIAEKIINFNEVILFGPTHAKDELFNILKSDHRFDKINIQVFPGDKMTETQQHTFVKYHFSK
jgi:stalled ribosome rescue protein Dom34